MSPIAISATNTGSTRSSVSRNYPAANDNLAVIRTATSSCANSGGISITKIIGTPIRFNNPSGNCNLCVSLATSSTNSGTACTAGCCNRSSFDRDIGGGTTGTTIIIASSNSGTTIIISSRCNRPTLDRDIACCITDFAINSPSPLIIRVASAGTWIAVVLAEV